MSTTEGEPGPGTALVIVPHPDDADFLAAGTIILARGEVHGLTTGAGMWLAGAIGLACGLGYWKIALFGTILSVLVLTVLYTLQRKVGLNGDKPVVPESDRGSSSDEER